MNARRVAILLLVGSTGAHLGCLRSLPFNHYILRAPQLYPGDLGEVRVGGRCVSRVGDLTVRVSGLSLGDTSLVILNFEVGDVGYGFDPSRTLMRPAGGPNRTPEGYVGPGRLDWVRGTYRTCVAAEGGATPLERRSVAMSFPLPRADTCFVLTFPTRIIPPADVTFELNGLSREGVSIPPLWFRLGEQVLWSNVVDVQPAVAP